MDRFALTTDRLVMKRLDITYSNAFFAYRSLPEVYEFQSFQPTDITAAEKFICSLAEHPNTPNTWFQLAVCLKDNHVLIGDIGIHFLGDNSLGDNSLEDDAQVEIGYTIAPDFQGQGYASEALHRVIDYLFSGLNKHRIIASVDPHNQRSIKVLEKLGLRKEAHFVKSLKLNGEWLDDCIYALLKEEWPHP